MAGLSLTLTGEQRVEIQRRDWWNKGSPLWKLTIIIVQMFSIVTDMLQFNAVFVLLILHLVF